MKARKKGSLSEFILLILEKAIDGYVRFEDFANHSYKYQYGIPDLKKSELAQALKRLREGGFVEEDRIDTGAVIFKLTAAGRDLLGSEPEDDRWDGKWRIVAFDIPEQKRLVRDLFRRNLKKWNFQHLQKSIWVSKRDMANKLAEYIRELGIEKWVLVIETDKIIGENNILNDR